MGTLTRVDYQFDASISVEDSETYLSIVNDINSKLNGKLNDAIQNLNLAKSVIDFDTNNQSIILSKIKEIDDISNKCDSIGGKIKTSVKIYEEYDSSLKEILDNYLIDGIFNGMEIHFKDDGTVEEMGLDKLFEYFDGNQDGYYYGCNQNPYAHIKETDPEYYEYLREMMAEKYGLSEEEIDIFMNTVDGKATCTYARCVNDVIFAYRDRPDLFQETFGYPLYIKNSEGKMILNYTELLTDYIVTSCINLDTTDYTRPTIIAYEDGKYNMYPDGIVFGDMQGWDSENEFFRVKTDNSKMPLQCEVTEVCNNNNNLTKEELKQQLENIVKNGNSPTLGMCPKGIARNNTTGGGAMTIPFYLTNSDIAYQMGGGHWISITEITDEGIIVDSWGERCLVTYEDLLDNSCYNVYETKFRSGV